MSALTPPASDHGVPAAPADFAARLLAWFDCHGRHDLPWQHPRSAYRVWLAEIMLQQTQVATVIPYYLRFLQRFPSLPALAAGGLDEVLALWSGLGYYSRARNLHAAAQACVERHAGELPSDPALLQALPGIGRSTAAAIAAQAYDLPHAILDGNVKRVLCRLLGIDGWPGEARVEAALWRSAQALMPATRCADYTQAIMDFGATRCSRARPVCSDCPFAADCRALASDRVALLPARKPRKASPQRRCDVLLLLDRHGCALLQRKPPSGVWAGLWSLPQFADQADLDRYLRSVDRQATTTALPAIDHVFTHFRLRLQPHAARTTEAAHVVGDNPDLRWASRAELTMLGLPAPIRRLLETCEELR